MGKYSDIIITDDNEDEESEKLAEQKGFWYIGFKKQLSNDFYRQEDENGYEEWVSSKILPNFSIDCVGR